jgi:hypothetical protein
MFVNDREEMSIPYREPSIDASYQVSVHLATATGNNVSDWSISKSLLL